MTDLPTIRRILAETLPAYGRVTERDIERAAVALVGVVRGANAAGKRPCG